MMLTGFNGLPGTTDPSRLVVNFGIPIFAQARCIFDKQRGTVKIERRSLLHVWQEEFPLSFLLDFYVRRGRKRLTTRYTAILKFRRRERLELHSINGSKAKKAVRSVREFLYN